MTARAIVAQVATLLVALAIVPAVAPAAGPSAPALPGFSVVEAAAGGGTLLSGAIPSRSAPRPLRPGFVYLPPGFDISRRYPVVYLLHGMPGAPGEYVGALGILHVADGLIATGSARPFIAVMPAAGPTITYNGEWAGPWESYLVADVVPWVDRNLPTLATPAGRTIAGLSAGGFGAADIGLRSPRIFGRIEAWSAYFHPLPDGPFAHADRSTLRRHDPFELAVRRASLLQRLGTKFFISSGPTHSHWFKEQQTVDFVAELRRLRLPTATILLGAKKGMYTSQLVSGLRWALGHRATA